jgi:hypothetical protein
VSKPSGRSFEVSSYQINAIVTRTLLDPTFKNAILNGHRRQKLLEFELTEELVNAIMQIEGKDIHHFVFQLNNLLLWQKAPDYYNLLGTIFIQRPIDHCHYDLAEQLDSHPT